VLSVYASPNKCNISVAVFLNLTRNLMLIRCSIFYQAW
jgi:hypothetical protein